LITKLTCLSELSADQQMALIGGYARDYGSHSFRKGNVTTLTSNPDGPPIASIFLRAQWQSKLGKAQQQYIFTGVGGDQLSGRIAAGLSMMDETFAALPPHWNPSLSSLSLSELKEIIAGYDNLDSTFQTVIPYLLASVIYHSEWVKNHYPSQHPIFNTRFWTNNYHMKYRNSIITGDFYNEISKMKASGVSGLLRKMYTIEKKIDQFNNNMHLTSPVLINSSGSLSEIMPILTSIQSQISAGFAETKEAMSNLTENNATEMVDTTNESYKLFTYNGGFHKIPEGYIFTVTTIKEFWNLYYFGVPAISFRPFRMLERKDFMLLQIENIYKNMFSNGCCVMRQFALLLQDEGLINNIRELNNASPESSNRYFLEAYKIFINKYCAGKDTQPAIATAYKKIREYNKSAI